MLLTRAAATYSLVMRGLDPRIHHLLKNLFVKRCIAGSSPAMTSRKSDDIA
jgi:hypothetical protein